MKSEKNNESTDLVMVIDVIPEETVILEDASAVKSMPNSHQEQERRRFNNLLLRAMVISEELRAVQVGASKSKPGEFRINLVKMAKETGDIIRELRTYLIEKNLKLINLE